MENSPFFSIVMPIYNVEPYLEKAIDSVLCQTFQDFEIILVNDCSPDGCASICERYSKEHSNIITLTHLENKGLSGARNTGLTKVSGQYVWFMDSDDYVDADLLENVYQSLCENRAEIVVFGCVEDYYNKDGEIINSIEMKPEEALCSSADELRQRVLDLEVGTFYGYAWNKFYSAEYIRKNNFRFENIVLIEDIKFNIAFCNNIERMNILGITPYHYAKRGTTSLTSKFVPNYYEVHRERIELLYKQQQYWGMAGDSEKAVIAKIYARYIFSALSRNCDKRGGMSHKDRVKWLEGVFEDSLFNELIPFANAKGFPLKAMVGLLQKKRKSFCLAVGRIIYIIQHQFQSVFVNAKQVRE